MQLAAARLRASLSRRGGSSDQCGESTSLGRTVQCPRNMAAFQPEASNRNITQVRQGAKLCGMACHIPDYLNRDSVQ